MRIVEDSNSFFKVMAVLGLVSAVNGRNYYWEEYSRINLEVFDVCGRVSIVKESE